MRHGMAILAAGALFALGACSDDDDSDSGNDTETTEAPDGGETTEPGGEGAETEGAGLEIQDFSFGDATAAAGSTLTVSNADGAPHTVTSDDDAWEVLRVEGGSDGELAVPAEAGEYAFHCDIHPTMTGTLVVE